MWCAPMRTVVGHSNDPLTPSAIEQVISDCKAKLDGDAPVAAILFAGVDMDAEVILTAIEAEFPGLPLVGCTTDGEVSSALSFQEDSVALLLFAGDGLVAGAGVGTDLSTDPHAAARAAIEAAGIEGRTPQLCVVFPESLTTSAVSVVAALNEALPEGTALVGGTAGDQWRFDGTNQFCGAKVYSDSLPVLLLYGDFKIGVGVQSGWNPIGERGAVTKAEGGVVYEVDGDSALAFYHRYFGDQVRPSPEYPIGVFDNQGGAFYLRAPLAFNDEDGSVTFAGDVPHGAEVQITAAAHEDIVAACEKSIRSALEQMNGAKARGALVISCAARKQLLGTRTGKEHEILRGVLGDDVPLVGFYSYGEIAPHGGVPLADFHNETFVTVLLGD